MYPLRERRPYYLELDWAQHFLLHHYGGCLYMLAISNVMYKKLG